MTLREACQILSDLHTRPSRDLGVIVDMHRMPQRGREDRYIEAWLTLHRFANEPAPAVPALQEVKPR